MKNRRTIWAVVAVTALIVLCLLALKSPPLQKAKTRPSRIATVNRVSTVSMVMTNTNLPVSPTR